MQADVFEFVSAFWHTTHCKLSEAKLTSRDVRPMSKFTGIIVGGLEAAAGAVLLAEGQGKIGMALLSAGIGTIISGIGTLLSHGPMQGSLTSSKNPVAAWLIAYGQNCVGGTPVYINSWGDNDKYLDIIIVVAAHTCKDIFALRFDGQRVQIDTSAVPPGVQPSTFPAINGGTSFTPVQQTIDIASISRFSNQVTVTLAQNIPLLVVGDYITVKNVTDLFSNPIDVNGKWVVSQIVSQVFGVGSPPSAGSIVFQYISGGEDFDPEFTLGGKVVTNWVDYGRKVYMETLLGKQLLGDTFFGMLNGTPADGNTGNLIKPDTINWTSRCSLQGKTAVFLRLHYNDVYFSNGIPQISFLLHGKDDIYDPRVSPPGIGYSNNASLCIADYLTQGAVQLPSSPGSVGIPQWGYGALYGSEVPLTPLILAANICDEQVQLAPTILSTLAELNFQYQTENRYSIDGHFTLDYRRSEILQNMLTAMAGRITYQDGQWIIQPGAWNGGGTSNVPQLRPNYCLYGAFCDTNGVLLESFYLGNGPTTITVPTYDVPLPFYDTTPGAHNRQPTANYPDKQPVARLQLGVNCRVGDTGGIDCGHWEIEVIVNGVATTVTVPATTVNWRSVAPSPPFPPSTFMNMDVELYQAAFATDPVVIPVSPGDVVTVIYLSGVLCEQLPLWPQTDANGNGNAIVGNDPSIAVPSHYTVTAYNGFQAEVPDPTPVLAGVVKWVPKRSYKDLYNGVKGTYVSPANSWQPADFPPFAQDVLHGYNWSTAEFEYDQNLQDDQGNRLWKDIQLPFTISFAASQRIAKIYLLRIRFQGAGTFKFNMWGYQLTALDIILMTYPFFGWVNKYLEVIKHRFLLEPTEDEQGEFKGISLSTEVDAQETSSTIYDWQPSEQLGPQGYQESILPSTTPNPPPNFLDPQMFTGDAYAVVGTDGVSRAAIQLQWIAPTDGWMTNGGHIELRYQVADPPPILEEIYNGIGHVPLYSQPPTNLTWILLPNCQPTITSYKIDIEMDQFHHFRVQIRWVNAAGVPSDWVDFFSPADSALPLHAVIVITPVASGTHATPPDNVAVNGNL